MPAGKTETPEGSELGIEWERVIRPVVALTLLPGSWDTTTTMTGQDVQTTTMTVKDRTITEITISTMASQVELCPVRLRHSAVSSTIWSISLLIRFYGAKPPQAAAIATILWLLSEVQMQMQMRVGKWKWKKHPLQVLSSSRLRSPGIKGGGGRRANWHASHMPVAKFALAQVKRCHRVDNELAACQWIDSESHSQSEAVFSTKRIKRVADLGLSQS